MGALFAYGPADFEEFDVAAMRVLGRGLSNATRSGSGPVRGAISGRRNSIEGSLTSIPELRFGKTMDQVTHAGMDVILTVIDRRTGGLVRFGSATSCSSSHGRIIESIDVTMAMAASVANPLHGRGIQRSFTVDSEGRQRYESFNLAAGDLHDKLGLLALDIRSSVCPVSGAGDVRSVISCDGWYGTPTAAWSSLMREWASTGRIASFALVSLDMPDEHLPTPLADLISRNEVAPIHANYAPLSEREMDLLATRGEQLGRMMLSEHCPDLV